MNSTSMNLLNNNQFHFIPIALKFVLSSEIRTNGDCTSAGFPVLRIRVVENLSFF